MTVIDDYLDKLDTPQKDELERIRKIVKEMFPESEEVISYGMPGFKYKGKNIIWFAAFKDHMSIFPNPGPIEALHDKLENFKISKGTIQFTLGNPIPESVIREIITIRLSKIIEAKGLVY